MSSFWQDEGIHAGRKEVKGRAFSGSTMEYEKVEKKEHGFLNLSK